MGRFDLVIFDCDGVILDSREANRAYYNTILERFGRRLMNDKELSFVHMHTAEESVEYLFKDDIAIQKDALIYARTLDYTYFLDYLTMEPGIEDAIRSVRPPLLTAVFTNRSTTMSKIIKIFGLDRWFDIVVCALDVSSPKPDPEGMFKILDILGVEKDRTVYIGDSVIDEIVAYRAGIPLIAYKNNKLKAMFHVEHFEQIKSILSD
ncbi:MAG: HAD hydrolase-like protein [Deltaproteobacteria bacterium]|nr:HAD hydrolase-like protein [Deltaproteobacteria bacterium]MCW7073244.1 HAD family hydrolase [Methanophagales archaeon]PXF54407.1 MAG: beta-phosphoglucomutase [Deltaproteobacteria bacterium]